MIPIPKLYLAAGGAVLAVALLLAVAGSYKIAYDKGEAAGQAKVKAEIAEAEAKASATAKKKILNAGRKLQHDEDQINASGDDGPLAGVLRDQLVRMRGG